MILSSHPPENSLARDWTAPRSDIVTQIYENHEISWNLEIGEFPPEITFPASNLIEISAKSLRCAQCFRYKLRWCMCTVPRVRAYRVHILWCRAVSCTISGFRSSNMACRDGFPSRRLVSSNTPLAPGANLGQACPVTIWTLRAVIWSQLWF